MKTLFSFILSFAFIYTSAKQVTFENPRYAGSNYYNPKDSVMYNGKMISKKKYERSEFETYFMPGAGYSFYRFLGKDSVGDFSGATIDYLLYAKSHQNDDFGPSHVRVYARFNVNKSTAEGVSQMFVYNLGLQMSVERNPKRNYLIPYFGMEMGGISHKTLGTTMAFYPIGGVHAIATKNIYINLHGGYIYPLSNYDLLHGYCAQATFNFALW